MTRRESKQKIQEIPFKCIAVRMSERDNVAIAKNDIKKNTAILKRLSMKQVRRLIALKIPKGIIINNM